MGRSRAQQWLLVSSALACVAALAVVIGGLVLVLKTQSVGVLGALPEWAILAVMALGATVVFGSALGCIGAATRGKCVLVVYGVFMLIAIIAQIVCASVLMLYAFDQPTVLDDAVLSARNNLDDILIDYARTDPAGWVESQDLFGCCGVDFESVFAHQQFGLNETEFVDLMFTGTARECEDDRLTIVALLDRFGNFSAEADAAAEAELGNDFFCLDRIKVLLQQGSLYLGIAAVCLVALQLTSFISSSILLCCASPQYAQVVEEAKSQASKRSPSSNSRTNSVSSRGTGREPSTDARQQVVSARVVSGMFSPPAADPAAPDPIVRMRAPSV